MVIKEKLLVDKCFSSPDLLLFGEGDEEYGYWLGIIRIVQNISNKQFNDSWTACLKREIGICVV